MNKNILNYKYSLYQACEAKKKGGGESKRQNKNKQNNKNKKPEKQTDKQIKKHISMISISTVSMRKY